MRRDVFTTIRSEGALLPPDFLMRIAEGDKEVPGLEPQTYHLQEREKLSEAITRSWNRLLGFWSAFQSASANLKEGDAATGLTRDKWLLPLFQELGYGRLPAGSGFEIEGKRYPISHVWQNTPIHLLGRNVDLDRPTKGVAGAARHSPHGLVQEFLNRHEGHLWGFLSSGLNLRILRDNKSLTRQAYVEFDVAGMMDGQAYSDFAVLWLLCHQSRVESERVERCWLEKWSEAARVKGTRALEDLRAAVEQAIQALGRGFLAYTANRELVERLRKGALDKQDYYRQLLRTVYRLIFLFVAEDRDLLLTAAHGSKERDRYLRHYSMSRLRTLAGRRRGSPHPDLWQGLQFVFAKVSSDGCTELGLPALGSFLWSDKATPDLDLCELANTDLLAAVRSLAFTLDDKVRRTIDYRNLGAEELGSVYESLLELHPEVNADAPTFDLKVAAGHERKTTGSYYTPASLIACLLDSALEPVLQEAVKQPDPENAILDLKVCDPACGSGHFLIAAAHRMANHLAAVRTGDEEPSPAAVRKALRDIVGRCLYGVDINPMAVELCKVNLWLEALEPGKPLSFLEHHIQCGNSLLGATPALLRKGIPDEAFEPLEGDDKAICRIFKKKNKAERESGQGSLLEAMHEPWDRLGELATALGELDAIPDDRPEGQRAKQERWEQLLLSNSYESGRLWAHAWCAAFVWQKVEDPNLLYPITEAVFRRIEKNAFSVPGWMQKEIRRLAEEYRLFHWHLAFPDVLRVPSGTDAAEDESSGWVGGFDVLLGNPPWEKLKVLEKEFFAQRHPGIANASNAAVRGRLIKALEADDPALLAAFQAALRRADGETALVRHTKRFPLCGRGDVNTYALFAELNRSLTGLRGRAGFIVPTGIATDDTTKFFFQNIADKGALFSLYDFQSGPGLFGEIGHARFKFCLLTLVGSAVPSSPGSEFAFFLRETSQLADPERRFRLSAQDIALLNPNTRTCPVFKTRRDAEITKAIYRRVPVLINQADAAGGNPWEVDFLRMLDMSNDSGLFRTRDQLEGEGWALVGNVFHRGPERYVPLYEAKMVHHFNHRYGDYADKPVDSENTSLPDVPGARLADPKYGPLPRYWVTEEQVVFRTSRVPASLIQALKARDNDMATQALAYWLAGYYLNQDDADAGKRLTERLFSGRVLSGSAQSIAVETWLAEGLAPRLERQCPLGPDGVAIIEGSEDGLSAASALIEAKCPRWFLGWRDICRSTDERTVIAAVIPRVGVGNQYPLMLVRRPELGGHLAANLSSFALDFAARQKVGGTHLNYFIYEQLPLLPPEAYDQPAAWAPGLTVASWMRPRILELTYTAWDLQPFAGDLGSAGSPFAWESERRFGLRCELDAAFFHLYGIGRENVEYIMDTFPIVRADDEKRFGEYRTRRTVLEGYDSLGSRTGERYEPPSAAPQGAPGHALGSENG